MDTKIVVAIVVLLLGGVCALVFSSAGGSAEQDARMVQLETQVSLLQERMATLEARNGRRGKRDRGDRADRRRTEREPEWGGSSDEERPRRRGRRGEDLASSLESPDPEVRERVSSLVREEMEAASEERWDQRRKRRTERIEQALTDFASAQSLTPADQDSLTDLWTDEREQIGDLFRKAREDMSWGKARQEAEALREETDASVKAMLSEENYAAWVQMREEENPHRR